MTEGGAPAGTDVAGCTVATRNYLADARIAARSFLDHHPGSRFVIVVVDGDHMPPADWSLRNVEVVTSSRARIAVVRSSLSRSLMLAMAVMMAAAGSRGKAGCQINSCGRLTSRNSRPGQQSASW